MMVLVVMVESTSYEMTFPFLCLIEIRGDVHRPAGMDPG